MSEYASRGRGLDSSFAPRSSQSDAYAPPPRTPAELAVDSVVSFERGVGGANLKLTTLRAANDANDLAAWNQAHDDLSGQLMAVRRELESARTRQTDATPDVHKKLADAEATLNEIERGFQTVQAPLGWKPVSNEDGILRALTAPIETADRTRFAQKEQATRDELQALTVAESRALVTRLRLCRPTDSLAVAFSKLATDRKSRLIAFLEDARRRASFPTAGKPSAQPELARGTGLRAENPTVGASSNDRASMEADIEQMIDTGEPNLARLAVIDGSSRRALVRRLETYRQGSGDVLGARFVRLDGGVRARLLEAIRNPGATPLHDAQLSEPATTELSGPRDVAHAASRIEPMSASTKSTTTGPAKADVAWAYLRANESNFVTAVNGGRFPS